MIPLALYVPEKLAAQNAFPEASEISTFPEAAPVGIRIQRKFPVPATSRVYPGDCVFIPILVPLL